jgi:hypothetical protein
MERTCTYVEKRSNETYEVGEANVVTAPITQGQFDSVVVAVGPLRATRLTGTSFAGQTTRHVTRLHVC